MGAITSLQPGTLPVDPGGLATVTLTVRNTGTVVDEFSIEILGETTAWASADPPSISLFPGAEGTSTITFRPPRAPSTRAGQVSFGVMARSKEDPAGSVVAEGALDVSPFLEPTAELIPRTSHGSRSGRHDVALDNRGNIRLEAAIEGIDADRLVRFDIDPPNLSVDPGVASFAKIAVKPAKTFLRGPAKSRPFTIAIKPDAANASPIVLDGSYLQESILPWWFVRALIALVALIVALVLLWLLVLQPSIKSTAADTLVEFGFSPKPGSPAGGGGGGGGGGSPTPAPAGALVVTPPPGGGVTQVDGRLDTTNNAVIPKAGTLFVTDLVFSNPTGAAGDLTLERTTPSGTTQLMVLRLENFRDLDFHFVTPITVRIDETLALVANCTTSPPGPAAACTPAVFYSGYVQAP
jgi:hypothetical protein